MIKELKIGKVLLKNNLIAAPIAGFSDAGFRCLCLLSGAGLAVGEMVSAKALHYKNDNTYELLNTTEAETPSCVQLFGSEPEMFAEAIGSPALAKFDIIDINMGCPVHKVAGNGEGSALMKKPDLARKIISESVRAACGRPVTVKFRSGWDDKSRNCGEFAAMCEESGASLVTVHARTREQMFGGNADINDFLTVRRAVKRIPVVANGDIRTAVDLTRIYEFCGADGFMIGRAMLGRPQIFCELSGREAEFGAVEAALKHIEILRRFYPDPYIARSMRGHLAHYLKGIKGSRELKNRLFASDDLDYIIAELSKI